MSSSDDLETARAAWQHHGKIRPAFAIAPGPGQESVWDYPRPPVAVRDERLVVVRLGELQIAHTRGAFRVLETASPPTFYLPHADVRMDKLEAEAQHSICEWKGKAHYFGLRSGDLHLPGVAWSYPDPFPEFAAIAGYIAFYPSRLECFVDGERVRAQAGGFYGGWITDEIVGPYKGEPGTGGW